MAVNFVNPIPRALREDPVFKFGLLLRLALIALLAPQIQTEWFVPFLERTIAQPSL